MVASPGKELEVDVDGWVDHERRQLVSDPIAVLADPLQLSDVGLIEYAHHGTLFLDEIGDMPRSSQVKLLRVLEHGEIVRVGSNEPIHIDVRLLAATHRNLRELIKENTFRSDLFYRLNVVIINLPPLREKRSDIPLLASHFVRVLADTHQKSVNGISDRATQRFVRYDWPGNVRELKNCIEHMIVVDRDGELGEDDLPEHLRGEPAAVPAQEEYESLVGQPLEEVEKRCIARTLELTGGNRERAAQLLGIGERTLYRKIQKYGLR